jgi:hypothetical protein
VAAATLACSAASVRYSIRRVTLHLIHGSLGRRRAVGSRPLRWRQSGGVPRLDCDAVGPRRVGGPIRMGPGVGLSGTVRSAGRASLWCWRVPAAHRTVRRWRALGETQTGRASPLRRHWQTLLSTSGHIDGVVRAEDVAGAVDVKQRVPGEHLERLVLTTPTASDLNASRRCAGPFRTCSTISTASLFSAPPSPAHHAVTGPNTALPGRSTYRVVGPAVTPLSQSASGSETSRRGHETPHGRSVVNGHLR